ncbi:AI-2E family transporter [Budviciaceae bacterium BWR-B9]|uniref:AI-2E family transporter n=2 Tax=Limnobaculum TaxID=2172100 RepID=A0A411WP11_9GAMM|nr:MULTISPECIES: AI-2E family transporter [Limnobaculum]MBK5144999.1 AI-2E family transporter [Limnobaculum allomyrinae]MBV7692830.1 AI-2E family transporter [Limnobaculum sp. M2-1]QBH97979.1 AI-2E family transporter [Limnobaculum zhutongyuii]TQS88162.1 AI-2E family transporter [Limnobaculum zhutongyuii]
MLEMLSRWYRRRFTDPQAVALLIILVVGFGIIYFFHGILAPLLVAIVLAYLLEWPTTKIQDMGLSRGLAATSVIILFGGIMCVAILVVMPAAWQQGVNLVADMPKMLNRFHDFAATLPARYPALVDAGIIDLFAENLRTKLAGLADSVVKYSMASLMGLLTLAIYLILVPLMVFFLLKDKRQMIYAVHRILPRNRGLAGKVWLEMNQQITNYIRGKVVEIVIVGVATYLVFWFMDMRYSLLLAVLVGISVLIPYIGAVLITIPVFIVALFQWGIGPDFWTLVIAYLVVQGLDSNILVPFLFSEAVNLHPLVIILSVVIFGGLWGFWGVFFAIPLATLVKAVIHVWPDDLIAENLR